MTRHYTHVGEVAAGAAVAALPAIGMSGASAAKVKPPALKPAKVTAAGLADVVRLLVGMTAENWGASRDKALAILRG